MEDSNLKLLREAEKSLFVEWTHWVNPTQLRLGRYVREELVVPRLQVGKPLIRAYRQNGNSVTLSHCMGYVLIARLVTWSAEAPVSQDRSCTGD